MEQPEKAGCQYDRYDVLSDCKYDGLKQITLLAFTHELFIHPEFEGDCRYKMCWQIENRELLE